MSNFKRDSILVILIILVFAVIASITSCSASRTVNMPIVLLTDFGAEDYRISQLKGIIMNNNREARIIDASHSVPAFDIATGAFMLDTAAKEFPENVVFISVIAPYDQTDTKYFVLTTNKNQFFVLPDNGLSTHVINSMGARSIYRITNQKLFKKPIKNLSAEHMQGTIGALISSGYSPENVGQPFTGQKTLDVQQSGIENRKLIGTVIYIDHYGNSVTNIAKETVDEFGLKPGDSVSITISQKIVTAVFGTIYSDVSQGKEIVFVNNNLGTVQLSINLGNFSAAHGTKAGTRIEIEKR